MGRMSDQSHLELRDTLTPDRLARPFVHWILNSPFMATAQPRFPLDETGWWVDHCAYADELEVESIGRTAGQRGLVYEAGIDRGCRWKTRGRSVHWCLMNSEASVNEHRPSVVPT